MTTQPFTKISLEDEGIEPVSGMYISSNTEVTMANDAQTNGGNAAGTGSNARDHHKSVLPCPHILGFVDEQVKCEICATRQVVEAVKRMELGKGKHFSKNEATTSSAYLIPPGIRALAPPPILKTAKPSNVTKYVFNREIRQERQPYGGQIYPGTEISYIHVPGTRYVQFVSGYKRGKGSVASDKRK